MATWVAASSSTDPGSTTWNFGQDTNTSASTTVWNQWITGTANSIPSYNISYRELTAEEREVEHLANEERERRQKEAEERAEKILDENLDEDQRKAYAERKVVPITTAKGRKYLIKKGRTGNVYRIDEQGKEVERFCIHPNEAVPDQDTMLGQLLWLRWCEDDFLRIANMTRLAA